MAKANGNEVKANGNEVKANGNEVKANGNEAEANCRYNIDLLNKIRREVIMSWVRIWVHLVYSTKNREPYLYSKEVREKVFNHIKENAKEKDIHLDTINGYHEHVHCLLLLNKESSISKEVQLIKGETSHWINLNKLIDEEFCWQDDYWAVGVSESHVEQVRKYILNQERHHRKHAFAEEIDNFMRKYGWQFIKEV